MKRVHELGREHAASRITAYVYGTTVTLASLLPLTQANAESGLSFLIVLGASLTTYLAHVIAECSGRLARFDERLTPRTIAGELRDSLPVLVTGIVPALMLGLAWLAGFPGLWAQLIAEAYVVVRLALTGWAIGRIRGRRASFRTFLAGFVLAAIGLVAAVLKVVLSGH